MGTLDSPSQFASNLRNESKSLNPLKSDSLAKKVYSAFDSLADVQANSQSTFSEKLDAIKMCQNEIEEYSNLKGDIGSKSEYFKHSAKELKELRSSVLSQMNDDDHLLYLESKPEAIAEILAHQIENGTAANFVQKSIITQMDFEAQSSPDGVNAGSFLRGNSVAMKLFSAYAQQVGGEYLGTFKPLLIEIGNYTPIDLENPTDQDKLKEFGLRMMSAISSSVSSLPPELRSILSTVGNHVKEKGGKPDTVIGAFSILRMITPHLTNASRGTLDTAGALPPGAKTLTLVANFIQKIANGNIERGFANPNHKFLEEALVPGRESYIQFVNQIME